MQQVLFDGQAVTPSKIVCVGRNYADHIAELGNSRPEQPVLFIKPNSAIAMRPMASPSDSIHYEAEISLLIRHGAVAGVGIGLDLTKRDLQARLKQAGLPWERAKAFDGAAVFSEFVPFSGDPARLRLELRINDRLAQSADAELMLTPVPALLAEIAANFSLCDHDLVMTGTPKGVGPLCPGDRYLGQLFDGHRLLVEVAWLVLG